jgi:hypothetical protein
MVEVSLIESGLGDPEDGDVIRLSNLWQVAALCAQGHQVSAMERTQRKGRGKSFCRFVFPRTNELLFDITRFMQNDLSVPACAYLEAYERLQDAVHNPPPGL